MSWLYHNNPFTNPQEKYVGFVYIIYNLESGRWYIGKKLFTSAGYKQIKKKRKKLRIASDWLDYFGSNRVLQEDVTKLGPDKFKREILRLCTHRSECTYFESQYIFDSGALLDRMSYNEWLTCKVTSMHTNSWPKPVNLKKLSKKKIDLEVKRILNNR